MGMRTKRKFLCMVLALAGLAASATAAAAADLVLLQRPVTGHVLPFPRGERAEAVWASGGCWTACSSTTTWTLAACLSVDSQGRCVTRADAGDRACQRTCRLRGGPYLAID